MTLPNTIVEIKNYLVKQGFPDKINAVVILGSGLGDFGREIANPIAIPYSKIPNFPQSTVIGHSGTLILGDIGGDKVLAFSGRFHFYEGHTFDKTVLPIKIAKVFNADKVIISNAAGGINLDYRVGDLMIIQNIIRLNMLVSETAPQTWSIDLYPIADKVKKVADKLGIATHRGSYLYVKGPNYETKAEIRAFRRMGGDAVGMSTAPELVEAARLGLKVTAISLITNAAAGVTDQKLDHGEVKDAAESKKTEFATLVKGLIRSF